MTNPYKRAIGASLVLTMLQALPAGAATIHVQKWGQDSLACGKANSPCETIQHAISERSGANDRIRVGPGLYLESLEIDQNSSGTDLSGLRLESTHGRFATVIRAPAINTYGIAVHQPRVRIGRRNRGFTVQGANSAGFSGIEIFPPGTRSRIEGNRVTQNHHGITIRAERVHLRRNIAELNAGIGIHCVDCDRGIISQNLSRENGDHGYQLSASERFTFQDNLAAFNSGIGSLVEITSHGYRLRNNVMEFNDSRGFNLAESDGSLIQNNIALLNHESGLEITQSSHTTPPVIRGNTAIFNDHSGIVAGNILMGRIDQNTLVDNDTGLHLIGASSFQSIRGNNTWSSISGCGVMNNTGGAVSYDRHYFGHPVGPDNALDGDGHDGLCGAVLATGEHAGKPNPFRAGKASRL